MRNRACMFTNAAFLIPMTNSLCTHILTSLINNALDRQTSCQITSEQWQWPIRLASLKCKFWEKTDTIQAFIYKNISDSKSYPDYAPPGPAASVVYGLGHLIWEDSLNSRIPCGEMQDDKQECLWMQSAMSEDKISQMDWRRVIHFTDARHLAIDLPAGRGLDRCIA